MTWVNLIESYGLYALEDPNFTFIFNRSLHFVSQANRQRHFFRILSLRYRMFFIKANSNHGFMSTGIAFSNGRVLDPAPFLVSRAIVSGDQRLTVSAGKQMRNGLPIMLFTNQMPQVTCFCAVGRSCLYHSFLPANFLVLRAIGNVGHINI
jgi:hypothetical protein